MVHSLMRKSEQNHLLNGGPDSAPEDTLHGEVNVSLEGAPLKLLERVIKDAKKVAKRRIRCYT